MSVPINSSPRLARTVTATPQLSDTMNGKFKKKEEEEGLSVMLLLLLFGHQNLWPCSQFSFLTLNVLFFIGFYCRPIPNSALVAVCFALLPRCRAGG